MHAFLFLMVKEKLVIYVYIYFCNEWTVKKIVTLLQIDRTKDWDEDDDPYYRDDVIEKHLHNNILKSTEIIR